MKKNCSVCEIEEKDFSLWDELIENSPQYNIFSSFFWLKTISEATGLKYKMVISYQKDIPLYGCAAVVRNSLEGTLFTSTPVSPYSSILLFPSQAGTVRGDQYHRQEALKSLLALSQFLKSRFNWLVLYMHPDFKEGAILERDNWNIDKRYTYYLDLSDSEKLYSNFESSLKRQIKKGQKADFQMKEDIELPEMFYQYWSENFERQKITPPLSLKGFRHVYQQLVRNKLCRTFSSYDEKGVLTASVVFLCEKDLAYYWASILNKEYSSSGANQFLLWEGLQKLSEGGIKRLDFVGADVPSIAAYKKKFGGKLTQHQRIVSVSSFRARTVRRLKKVIKSFALGKND